MHDIKITITGTETCPRCEGSGLVWPSRSARKNGDESEMIQCPNCDGEGEVTESQEITLAEFRALMDAAMEEGE